MRVRKRDRYKKVTRWKTLLSITYSILFLQMNSKVCTWEKQKMKVEDMPSDHIPQPAGTPVTTAPLQVALLTLSKFHRSNNKLYSHPKDRNYSQQFGFFYISHLQPIVYYTKNHILFMPEYNEFDPSQNKLSHSCVLGNLWMVDQVNLQPSTNTITAQCTWHYDLSVICSTSFLFNKAPDIQGLVHGKKRVVVIRNSIIRNRPSLIPVSLVVN